MRITPSGVMIASQDRQALDEFEEWLTTLAGGTMNESAYPTIFYLKYAKATKIAEVLGALFGGRSSGGGGLIGDLAGAALGDLGGGGGVDPHADDAQLGRRADLGVAIGGHQVSQAFADVGLAEAEAVEPALSQDATGGCGLDVW